MRHVATGLLLVALAATWAAPVRSQAWSPYTGLPVDELVIEGLAPQLTAGLRKGLALTPRDQLFGKNRTILRDDAVQSDRERILLYLARRGYSDASVSVRAEPTDERKYVRLVFEVAAGYRVDFGEASVEGVGAPLDEELREVLAPALSPIEAGRPFLDARVQEVRANLIGALEEEGYARPQVNVRVGTPGAAGEGRQRRAPVVFRVRPGERFRFGTFDVRGVGADLEALARREVRVPPGEPYRPRLLRYAREDLRALELFRQVNINTTVRDSNRLDVTASLAPRPMRTLEFSVGTWSDHPVQVDALWRHRNLLQRGRGVRTEGSYALRQQDAAVALEWPSLLVRRSTTQWRVEVEREDEEAYLLESAALRWTNLFRVGRKVSWRAGVALLETALEVRGDDVELFDVEPGRQLILEAQWYLDAVDDPLDPGRGWRFLVEGNWAPVLDFTDAPFSSLRGMLTRIQPVGMGITLASRLDFAWAEPLGDANDLLPSQRWFAGGFNTMRGASRRGLGPADEDGDAVGGEIRFLGGAELRIPIAGMFGMSTFMDTGQVWSEPDRIEMRSILVAVGGGLLVYTPIGPIHLEVARNLGVLPLDGDRWQLQFGIGHPY